MAKEIRVLLIAPSLDILGGQAVQATRLIEGLSRGDIKVDFQPINPAFPAPLKWVKKVPFLRTALTFSLYITQIAARTWRYDILHVFSAGLSSFTLWTIPAVLIGRKTLRSQVHPELSRWTSRATRPRLEDGAPGNSRGRRGDFAVRIRRWNPEELRRPSVGDLQRHRFHTVPIPAALPAPAGIHDQPDSGASL